MIEGPVFDSSWRKSCVIEPCAVSTLDRFVRAHYLQKRPAIVLLALVMKHNGAPVGCVVYSAPPREADKRYGGKTWELARLYLLDEIPRNAETWLIGASVRFIKRYHPTVEFLLSYADPSAGHSGTIYKASNWIQDGMTDDERKSPRCDYVDSRTGRKYGRKGNMPVDALVKRVPRVSKFRFYMPLQRKQKNNLTEKQFPVYPSLYTNPSTSNDMTTKMLALIAGVLSTAFSQIQNICLGGTEPDAPPADAPKKTRGPVKAAPAPEAEEETDVTVETDEQDTVDYDELRARAMSGVQKLFTIKPESKTDVKKLLVKHGAGKISELADNKVQPFMDDVRKLAK